MLLMCLQCKSEYSNVCALRAVSIIGLVNSPLCGVGVSCAPLAQAWWYRIQQMHMLFASTYNINMSDQTNKHTHILIDTKYDMYMFFNFSFNIMYVYMFFKSINTYICLLIQNVLEVKWLHLRARWRWILSLHMFFPSTYNICMSFNVEKHTYMCFNTKHNIYMSCNSRI